MAQRREIRQSVGVSIRGGDSERKTTFGDADFDALSFHDCHIHGIELRTGDPGAGDWTHDLALDIDFVVDGSTGPDGRATFLVAPAWLVFLGVTGLRIAIEWAVGGTGQALHPASISQIVRRQVDSHPQGRTPEYEWSVDLNWPDGGTIAFSARAFTMHLRGAPVEVDARQHLSSEQRGPRPWPGMPSGGECPARH